MLVRWQPQQQMTFDRKDHHCIVCHLSESEVYCSGEWSQSSSTASFSWPASASLAASSASAAALRYWPCWQRLSKGRCQLCCYCNCFSPLYLLRLRRHVEEKKKGGAAVAATPAALHPRKSVERSERSRREVNEEQDEVLWQRVPAKAIDAMPRGLNPLPTPRHPTLP